jgi:dTDP-4-dehydrorhamnose reductase
LDLCDLDHLALEIVRINPQFIINCVAVGSCRNRIELSDIWNQAVAVLAKWSQTNNCKPLHISTDYVFDGTVFIALTETAATNPINVL